MPTHRTELMRLAAELDGLMVTGSQEERIIEGVRAACEKIFHLSVECISTLNQLPRAEREMFEMAISQFRSVREKNSDAAEAFEKAVDETFPTLKFHSFK